MYLYYYLNEKLVGTVDIEVFMELKTPKVLVTCSEDDKNLLCSLELMYGKQINRRTSEYARLVKLPSHVFTTKRCGKVLTL